MDFERGLLSLRVTAMKRPKVSGPGKITLDPVFDVESDGELENRWSLSRFRVNAIGNVSLAGGSTAVFYICGKSLDSDQLYT